MIVELGDRAGVIPGGVNVGVLRAGPGRIVLIDTGLNDTSGKKVLKTVREELGAEVVAILTTHAHADHFGANATVVKRTSARVYAPAIDEAVLRYPLLQPSLLYGGADPIDTLRGRFLLADPSPVDVVVRPGPLSIEEIDIEVIPLFGHSPGQVGYLVDGVFYCADVVLPASVLEKYRIPYLYSATDHLSALEHAGTVVYHTAVPGHGAVESSLEEVLSLNRALIDRVAERIVDLTETPSPAETVLTGLLRSFGAVVEDAPSFYLLQPTVFAFLSHLQRLGAIEHTVVDAQSLWRATGSVHAARL